MRRLLALGLGLLVTLAPDRIVDLAERLVFENPDAGRLRPWTLPIARLKGVLFFALFVRRSERTTSFGTALAALGALLALAPRSMLRFGLRLAYENPNDLEVKPGVVPLARLLGACYLVAGPLAGLAGEPASDSRAGSADARRDC